MNDECKYYRELEDQYDNGIIEKMSDEELEDLEQLMCCNYSDETLNEIYEKLDEWDENKHLYK